MKTFKVDDRVRSHLADDPKCPGTVTSKKRFSKVKLTLVTVIWDDDTETMNWSDELRHLSDDEDDDE